MLSNIIQYKPHGHVFIVWLKSCVKLNKINIKQVKSCHYFVDISNESSCLHFFTFSNISRMGAIMKKHPSMKKAEMTILNSIFFFLPESGFKQSFSTCFVHFRRIFVKTPLCSILEMLKYK